MLKEKAIKGLKWTTFSSGIGVLIQFIQIAILARFLDSNAFGIMALATSFIGFSQLFLDMGISNAIIYNQDVNKQQLSSLFWLNLVTGWILFLLILATAPLVASFYHEPSLKNVISLIGVSFLIQPLEQQFYALMKKELLFNDIARRDIISKIISFIISVILAWNGFGVYSLVISYLCGVVIAAVLVIMAGLKFHRPTFHFKLSETKKFLSFGMFQTADSTLNYFNTQIDTFVIGKLLGVEVLGIYNIAKNLAMRPAQIINPIAIQVTFPVMAKLQHDDNLLKSVYLKSINYLSSCNIPIYLFICIMAEPIVLVLFGSKWLAAVPSLRILSIYYLVRSTINPVGSLLISKGKVKLSFYWTLAVFLITPAAIWLGAFYGLDGIIYANLIVIVLFLFAAWRVLVYPTCGATFTEFFGQLVSPIKIGIVLLPLLWVIYIIPFNWPLANIILAAGMLAIAILPLNKFFNRIFFNEVMNMVNPLLKKLSRSGR